MRNSIIIIKKQIKDTLKNKTILIQFILFPIMTLVMENAINLEGMPELFFTKLFSIMYIGMAPLTSVSAIISEEKEKNTLRVLMMANIKPLQYLLGVGIYVWTICMMGACIGILSKNQMSATSIVMPVMMILSFAPMLAMFNDTIKKFAKIFYTQQLKMCMDELSFENVSMEAFLIIAVNAIIPIAIFAVTYKRKGLE